MKNVLCDYCGKPTRFVDDSIVYGRSFGMIYYCRECRAWVGVHRGTDQPLGRLADAELRKYKKAAHAAFDPIWRRTQITRRDAYKWLAEQLGISEEETHIGMFDVNRCKQAIAVCKKRMEGFYHE